MKKFSIQQRTWLADEYAHRHHTDLQTAFAAVNDTQSRGRRSPHYDDVMAPARELLDAIKAGFAPILSHARERWAAVQDIMQPVIEWSKTEEGQAQLAEWKREREEEACLQSCNCLCQVVHGSLGVCAGEAARTLIRQTEALGQVTIPVCQPCADTQITPAT